MNVILSVILWACGLFFFAVSFFILSVCIVALPRKKAFFTARVLFGILLKIMGIRLKVSGTDHIDPEKTYLIMGNHQSLFDLFVIPVAIPLPFVAVEAAYHFSIPLWGRLVKQWGNIPIFRNDLAKAIESLETARRTIASGTSIIVLPEGHRTLDGKLGEFKKGPFHLAKNAGADILPFAVKGLFDYNRKNNLVLSPGLVEVCIGKPVDYASFKDASVDGVKNNIRRMIMDLGG